MGTLSVDMVSRAQTPLRRGRGESNEGRRRGRSEPAMEAARIGVMITAMCRASILAAQASSILHTARMGRASARRR